MSSSDFIYSFINTLNHSLAKDYEATKQVMLNKIPAKKELIDDSSIIVGGTEENPTLSGLSLLNSLIYNYCGKKIVAVIEEGTVAKFEVQK